MSKNLSSTNRLAQLGYQVVIGIEVHVQLKCQSKLFCACRNRFGDQPNTNICRVCTGYLGTLPVLNGKAVDLAILAGLATNCQITKVSEFSRKHYSYPDLPKNFQISQDDKPICQFGHLKIVTSNGEEKTVRIHRIHMEEDAGKSLHDTGDEQSLLDLNRAGSPLIEIVSEPDIDDAEQAVAYLEALRSIVRYLDVSYANMEEGSFRADVNLSVKKIEASQLGTKVELKNINSFRFISQAIEYEINRQLDIVESGGIVKQETRLWNEKEEKTVFMRSKENTHDYRFFTEPDLPLLIIDDNWIARLKSQIPELPLARKSRLIQDFALTNDEAELLTSQKKLADFFEQTVYAAPYPKKVSNWILRDLLAYLNKHHLEIDDLKITPDHLAELIIEIEKGVINNKIAQQVWEIMLETGQAPNNIIREQGLEQIGSTQELEAIIMQVLTQQPAQVEEYRSGNPKVLTFLIGQCMKATKGKGSPQVMHQLLERILNQR